jgi:hypothetical protein
MLINIMIWGIHIVSVFLLYSKRILFCLLIPAGLFVACDKTGEPIVPRPERVQMVYHSFADDTLANEIGIDAVPETDGIYLAWYSLKDHNIRQYNIYRRREDESFFRHIKSIYLDQVGAGRDTVYTDTDADRGLTTNKYYNYYVTATNTQDEEGGALDTLKYMLLDKAETRLPDGQTYVLSVDSLPVLNWDFVEIPDLYILRIENSFGQIHYIGIFHSNYDNNAQKNDLNKITDLPPFSAGTYLWRIDCVGPDWDNSGSESNWKTFSIIQ